MTISPINTKNNIATADIPTASQNSNEEVNGSEITTFLDDLKEDGGEEGCPDNDGWDEYDGEDDGLFVGCWLGEDEGCELGRGEGCCDGEDDGLLVGVALGL